jgi:hypothetical protein
MSHHKACAVTAASRGTTKPSTPFRHRPNAASVEMDAVVNVFDVGQRQEMVQPVGRIVLRQSNLASFDTVDNAHMLAIVAYHLYLLPDSVRRNHAGAPGARFEQTPVVEVSSRRMCSKLASATAAADATVGVA